MTEKMAVFAPIPIARVATAVNVNPGFRRSARKEYFRSSSYNVSTQATPPKQDYRRSLKPEGWLPHVQEELERLREQIASSLPPEERFLTVEVPAPGVAAQRAEDLGG